VNQLGVSLGQQDRCGLQMPRGPQVVGIEKRNPFTAGGFDAGVAGRGQSEVLRMTIIANRL